MYAQIAKIFHPLQAVVDKIAMYRVVSGGLAILAAWSVALGYFGYLPYSGGELLVSLALTLVTALGLNWLFSKVWRILVNQESAIITALLIFFLVIPLEWSDKSGWGVIVSVTALAIASKYLLAWRGQHVVNPAAAGLVLLAVVYFVFPDLGYFESTWWIGRVEMFVPLLVLGVAVVMKVRKWTPVLAFLFVGFAVFLFEEWRFSGEAWSRANYFWISGPSLFLAFFMLTEPFTMPPTKRTQIFYGALLGFISQTTLFLPFLKMTPELALVVANLAVYPYTLRRKLIMPLVEKRAVSDTTYEFSFAKPAGLKFLAGQYLEWMLPHTEADNRGVRRYFTIASGPNEGVLKMAVRFGDSISTYKQALKRMEVGDKIIASQLAGDFVLPDREEKLAWVAGGIGVTPFLSHLSDLKEGRVAREVCLYYCNKTVNDIAYQDELALGLEVVGGKLVHVLADGDGEAAGFESGYLSEDIIKKHTPDYLERVWYLSGPPGMVNAYYKLLLKMGVSPSKIKRDFFPGLA
jgi:glycine betaine catabolism B